MFHHFHDAQLHIPGQGSITAVELDRLIFLYRRREFNLCGASEWFEKGSDNRLNENDVCLTFDDGLRCQIDLAEPVLNSHGLTAFWFVYSSPLEGAIERLELYRYFRFKCFSDVNDFYSAFQARIDHSHLSSRVSKALSQADTKQYRSEDSYYIDEDRKFRYVRDHLLERAEYFSIMDAMVNEKLTGSREHLQNLLWMDSPSVQKLHKNGHIVGLHSHTHPTVMSSLSLDEQHAEYSENLRILTRLLSWSPVTMSHPANSYNEKTLVILDSLGIRLGFRANMEKENHSRLEFPRIDHCNFIKEIRE